MDEIINSAKEIGQFIALVIISLFVCKQYLNQYFKKTNVGKMLPRQNKLDLEILNKLEYVKEILNADRIHVYEFHNGEHYSDYRSAYKFSCTYEVFKAGNQPVQQRCINLPTNCMPQFIHRITDDGKFICKDLEELKTSMPSTYNFKKSIDVGAFYDIAIHNKEGNIIGFIAIHWINKENMKIDRDTINQLVWYVEEHLINSK